MTRAKENKISICTYYIIYISFTVTVTVSYAPFCIITNTLLSQKHWGNHIWDL